MQRQLSALHLLTLFVVSVLLFNQQSLAATRPLSEQLNQAETRVYTGLSRANHVFGYQFEALENGQIDQIGGYFSGRKRVVIVNDGDEVIAQALVYGDGRSFNWKTLKSPLTVEAGQQYRVLVRTGVDQTSAAAWALPMPFSQDGIQIVSLQQGWSSNADPRIWAASAQTLPEPHARGIVDINFNADDASAEPPLAPPDDNDPVVQPSVPDPFPSTAGVVDSFGQSAPAGNLGMGFMAVRNYYQNFPRREGECSLDIHNKYWVQDSRGITHPTWHPPVDPVTGCRFAHEHGDDPRTSPDYAFAQGVPFGMTHGSDAGFMRHEDHVGHKVVVQSNWGLVDGNPQNGRQPDSDAITRTGIQCNWLSKIHQGSWSRDALANNAHEYFLNLRCTDGVQLRLKQLITFGPPELVTNICNNPSVNQGRALVEPDKTSQAFPSGVAASSGTQVINPLDGKREFACIDNLIWKDQLEELWKSDGVIELPAGGFIHFSPYYVVLNPARYLDHRWAELGSADGYISSIDLCFNDNAAFRGQAMGFCKSVPSELSQLDTQSRQQDIRNPMNGTRRVIHPKNVVVYSANESGTSDTIVFCTNRLGRDARLPDSGHCRADEIEQMVSRSDRRQWGWSGSDVNSITVGNQLRGAGYLNEWVRDFNAPGIRFPN